MADWGQVARRIRVPLGFVFAILYVWLAKPIIKFSLLGLIVAIVGIVLRALASGHVRKNEALTTSGPYAYTRNPLYLGSLIIAIGFLIVFLTFRANTFAAGVVEICRYHQPAARTLAARRHHVWPRRARMERGTGAAAL